MYVCRMAISVRANRLGVSRTTLYRRATQNCAAKDASKKSLCGFTTTFTSQEDNEFVEHCIFTESRYFGLRISDSRHIDYHFLGNPIPHPVNKDRVFIKAMDLDGEF